MDLGSLRKNVFHLYLWNRYVTKRDQFFFMSNRQPYYGFPKSFTSKAWKTHSHKILILSLQFLQCLNFASKKLKLLLFYNKSNIILILQPKYYFSIDFPTNISCEIKCMHLYHKFYLSKEIDSQRVSTPNTINVDLNIPMPYFGEILSILIKSFITFYCGLKC